MVEMVKPLHFYQSSAGEICMVIFATPDEVLFVSYESDEPGLIEEMTRPEFEDRYDRKIPDPYRLAPRAMNGAAAGAFRPVIH